MFSVGQSAFPPWDAVRQYWSLSSTATGPRPLGFALQHFVLLTTSNEFWARLPSAAFSVTAVLVCYFLARTIVSRRTALLATLFLALCPFDVWYAQELRWYSQWSFLTLLGTLALVHAWRDDRAAAWVGYAAAVVLSLYTFIVALLMTACQALSAGGLFLVSRRRSFLLKCALCYLAALIFVLPSLIAALSFQGQAGGGAVVGTPRPTSPFVVPYTYFSYVAGFSFGPTLSELHALHGGRWVLTHYPEVLLYLALFGALAALGLWSLRRNVTAAAVLLPWVFGLPFLVYLVTVKGGQTYNVRYAMVAAPGFMILVAMGVSALRAPRLRLLASALVVVAFGVSLANYYWNPRYDKAHVRDAVERVRASATPSGPIVVVGQVAPAVQYYGTGMRVENVGSCDEEGPPAMRVDSLQAEPVVWLLIGRDWDRAAAGCMREFGRDHRVAERDSYPGVELVRLEARR